MPSFNFKRPVGDQRNWMSWFEEMNPGFKVRLDPVSQSFLISTESSKITLGVYQSWLMIQPVRHGPQYIARTLTMHLARFLKTLPPEAMCPPEQPSSQSTPTVSGSPSSGVSSSQESESVEEADFEWLQT